MNLHRCISTRYSWFYPPLIILFIMFLIVVNAIEPQDNGEISQNTVKGAAILLLILSGALGGFTAGILNQESNKIRLPYSGKLVELGYLGDMIIGISACTVIFVFKDIYPDSFLKMEGVWDFDKYIAIGVISGFAGRRLLVAVASKLVNKISEMDLRMDRVEESEKIRELNKKADFIFALARDANDDDKTNYLGRALLIYNEVLKKDPKNEQAYLGVARIHKMRGNWEEAIKALETLIRNVENSYNGHYKMAAYMYLSNKYEMTEIMSHLETAIRLSPFLKEYARMDAVFEKLHDNKVFNRMTK